MSGGSIPTRVEKAGYLAMIRSLWHNAVMFWAFTLSFAADTTPVATPSPASDYITIIASASLLVKLVLLLLLFFSIVSWAIIGLKMGEYRRADAQSRRFLSFFRRSKNLSEVFRHTEGRNPGILGTIFRFGYDELARQMNDSASTPPDIESVNRALTRAANQEILKLEKLNGFLATTAAVTPFIGLFGTVWGIMSAFHNIGAQGNANLATVAPGIAEALIATALGLFAAIPAAIFYNLLLARLKQVVALMDDFVLEFLNLASRIKS